MTDVQPFRRTKATLDILRILLDGETHGYAIAQATGRSNPAVYESLRRLVTQDLIEARTEPNPQPGLPDRRIYRLTVLGRLHAQRLLDDTEQP